MDLQINGWEARVQAAYTDWCKKFNKESDEIRFKQFSDNFLKMSEEGKEMILNEFADSKEYIAKVFGRTEENLFCRLTQDTDIGLGYVLNIRDPVGTLAPGLSPTAMADMKVKTDEGNFNHSYVQTVDSKYQAAKEIEGSVSANAKFGIGTFSGKFALKNKTSDAKASATRAMNIFHRTQLKTLHVHHLKMHDFSVEGNITDYSHIVTSLSYGKSCSGVFSLESNTKNASTETNAEMKAQLKVFKVGLEAELSTEAREELRESTFSVDLSSLGANDDEGIANCNDVESFVKCTHKFCSETVQGHTIIGFHARPLAMFKGFENCVTLDEDTQNRYSEIMFDLNDTLETAESCEHMARAKNIDPQSKELFKAADDVRLKVLAAKRALKAMDSSTVKNAVFTTKWNWANPDTYRFTDDSAIEALREKYNAFIELLPGLLTTDNIRHCDVAFDEDDVAKENPYFVGDLRYTNWYGTLKWSDELTKFPLNRVFGTNEDGLLTWKLNGDFGKQSKDYIVTGDKSGIYLTCQVKYQDRWETDKKQIPLENDMDCNYKIDYALVSK